MFRSTLQHVTRRPFLVTDLTRQLPATVLAPGLVSVWAKVQTVHTHLEPTATVPGREPLLFTPGPLTCSPAVKQAMLVDLGSRDTRMMKVISEIRQMTVEMAGATMDKHDCVIVQGSGTFAVEAVVSSVVPPASAGGRILICSNGAYGDRMAKMCQVHGIAHDVLRYEETEAPSGKDVTEQLKKEKYTHVGCIHHETTAGTLNPIREIGQAIKAHDPNLTFIVDSMSGFGAYPINMEADNISYMVSSANKNIEGVPGFAFAIVNKAKLQSEGVNARTLSMDVKAQAEGIQATGQFRFTPPTHAMLAFRQALEEHAAEGGQPGRLARYTANFTTLTTGMSEMGFQPYLDASKQGCIITTFLYPEDPAFVFSKFFDGLSARGIVIYPGKTTKADCFRIGSIGRLYPKDMQACVSAVRDVLTEMGVALPVKQIQV